MKLLPIATSLLIAGSLATATSTSPNKGSSSLSARSGSKAARAMAHEAYEKKFPEIKKRCSKKKGSSSSGSSSASNTSSSSGAQSTGNASKGKSGSKGSSSGSQSGNSSSGSSSGSSSSNGSSNSSGNSSGSGSGSGSGSDSGSDGSSNSSGANNSGSGGDMSSKTNSCGSSDASSKNPNGSKEWLNCGINGDGWNPGMVKLSDVKVISDDEAAKSSTFQPCQKYASEFKSASSSTGIPVAILMSIAMQESTCNANANGSRGEVGMMQITQDKCGGAPGGNCHDPEFNIKKGGQYLKDTTDQFGGNFLEALGQYNGWTKGMKASGNCGPQGQNINYVNGNLNGFFQGNDGYGSVMGAC